MLQDFKKHIQEHFAELTENTFLLACSGGMDSVVLTQLCEACGMDFAMAHCNFKLRDSQSDKDEVFVRELAKKINKKIFVTSFNTEEYAVINKVSIQMAARKFRYEWFEELMKENDIPILVTAHHADDDLETFLINLSRGTGIKGLIGIPAKTERIMRPLLAFTREQIESYAQNSGFSWREDASNLDIKYLRNKIRHELVPLLKELHPTFLENFITTQHQLGQTAQLSTSYIQKVKAELFEQKGDVIYISINQLQALLPINTFLYGLFNTYGFTNWGDIHNLLVTMSGKEVRSKTHRLIKDRDHLLLVKIAGEKVRGIHIDEGDKSILAPVHLTFQRVEQWEEKGRNTLFVDKETLKYPLHLRKWKKGDYFYPMGMHGKKKLSKYFKDEKMSVVAKEQQWLLCSGEHIVWVVGKRGDDRFKVSDGTKQIERITLSS